MKEPTYLDAIKKSWQLTWQHKSLWVFGLFAAFWGQLGILKIISKLLFASNRLYVLDSLYLVIFSVLKLEFNFSFEQWMLIIWLIVMISSLVVGFVFVATVCQGALIDIANKFFKGRKKLKNAEKAWHEGVKHFWKLLAVNLIKKVSIFLIVTAVSWGAINALLEPTRLDNFLFIFLFALAILVGITISFLTIYTACYVVVENYSLPKSITSAWHLFIDHWLVSVEVGAILLIINFLMFILFVAALYILFLPGLFLWFLASLLSSTVLFSIGSLLSFFLFFLFIILLGSFFTVFNISVWTYLFTKMHKGGVISRLLHWGRLHK